MAPERVDFYVLNRADDASRLGYACMVAAKAWRRGHRVYMQVDTPGEAEALDRMLWEYQEASFVPHARTGTPEAAQSPVLIGTECAPEKWRGMLVSLTRALPEGAAECRRVADLIADDRDHRAAGRERFRAYRAMGVEPGTHEIRL